MTQKMLHVALEVAEEDAPRAAYLLARYGVFSPERSLLGSYSPGNSGGQRYHDAYTQARARLGRLAEHFQGLPEPAAQPGEPPSLRQLQEINAWLEELLHTTDECKTSRERFAREMQRETALLDQLEPFKALDLDLKLLARPKRFIQTLVGTLPEANLDALETQLAAVGGLLEIFGRHQGQAYVVTICPLERCPVTRAVLATQGWQEYPLPPEFSGPPQQVEADLKDLCAQITRRVDELSEKHAHTFAGIAQRLAQTAKAVDLAEPYARLVAETVTAPSGQLQIRGWIPARHAQRLESVLAGALVLPYQLSLRPPETVERETVPSGSGYPAWLGPFADLVRGYGVPCYGDFDPTLFFTLSFIAMFGMMFGDVGHGLTIMLAALFLRRGMKRYRPLLLAAGAASCGFGALYGSVFGLEEVIEPLWISPLSDPLLMLEAALWWGVGFLLATQLITLRNHLAARDWSAALFDAGGVAGALLYLGSVAAVYLEFTGRPGVLPASLLAVAGFCLVLVYTCSKQTEKWPDRLLLSLMQSLESVFNDFVNTLSFMRVAAFSISHVALAVAISTLSAEMSGVGQVLTLIIGNALILVLEGSIVAIQVLRLEYYEGFSRYFTCFGRDFKPMLKQP